MADKTSKLDRLNAAVLLANLWLMLDRARHTSQEIADKLGQT